ncbi:unnamed protein product [Cyclocybe aegerita]|uniref:Uncharacterized protein n=1 Tax=Cyclocybe aegerita TaxID=1973307 RepID=A0A8S0WC25_CYCAE|nr:unnamed protein product [Cyclocybe aegerita]
MTMTMSNTVPGGSQIRRMDFLWVRWFGDECNYHYGSKQARLPLVGFVPSTIDGAFGFLDPTHVIRGCHLIPAYAHGRSQDLLPVRTSDARCLMPDEEDDWTNFYVNLFVDRDMIMRHFGGGVGHSINALPEKTSLQGTTDENREDSSDSKDDDQDMMTRQVAEHIADMPLTHSRAPVENEEEEDAVVQQEDEDEEEEREDEDEEEDKDKDKDNGYASL